MSAVNLLDLAAFTASAEHDLFRELRGSSGLYFNPEPDGAGFWSAVRYCDVEQAARQHTIFISGEGTQIKNRRAEGHGAPSVHNSDLPIHGKLRAIVMPGLSRSAVEKRSEQFADIVDALLADVPRGEVSDYVEKIAIRLPMLVIAAMLGVPDDEAPLLVDWANLMSDVRATNEEQAEARAHLFEYFRGLADQKRNANADDIASLLVQAKLNDAPLEQQMLDAYFMLLTVAGNETTRFLMTGGLAQLVRQDDWPKLRDTPGLIPSAIEEMCRFVSPVTHMRRTASQDTELAGQKICKGDKLVLWFASANRDEAVFADPDKLVLDRSPNPHMGFGIGAHFCLGTHLARFETKLFFEALARQVQQIELCEAPERLPSNWFTGWTKMMVRFS
ncbi:cytochrome P450 [Sphingorhabdus arenilitoris]|uniref:Cytochrome P450 n=1 Tax=Sphingorhabdus arenilitoris TaxID=1490041 RepID=A0ABV8RHA0_9SPHN